MNNSLVQFFLAHQAQLKMYHFQTGLYGAHKAVDAYLTQFALVFDRFMESSQGAFGKVTNAKVSIQFDTVTDDNVIYAIDQYIGKLRSLNKTLAKYQELLNIRDELVDNAQQLKYLLTFK